MNKRIITAVIVFSWLILLLTACTSNKTAETEQYLTIKGSDTMVHLVSNWAETYMKTHPNIDISVTGGGSGTGIAALINKTTDIAAASRSMKEEEIKMAGERGITPEEHAVARDGIAVVINPENIVNEFTMEQLSKIYTGEYTNWKQVGGNDSEIVLLSRESSSGTYVFFQEHVLNKQDYAQAARLMPSTSAIIQTVQADKGAIGYVGLGYAEEAGDKVKTLAVKKGTDLEAVLPSIETVNAGTYPIARPLFLYTDNSLTETVKDFLNFAMSEQGQEIVKEQGYIPVN